jgi:hypothetical protein
MQEVALAMAAIEGDPRLTQLTRLGVIGASHFRVQLQRVRLAAMAPMPDEAVVRHGLRDLEQLCQGRLECWRFEVRRAWKHFERPERDTLACPPSAAISASSSP